MNFRFNSFLPVLLLILWGVPASLPAVDIGSHQRSVPDTSPLTIPRHTIDTGPIRSDSVVIRHHRTIDIGSAINDLAYSSSGDRIAIAAKRVLVHETENYHQLATLSASTSNVDFTPDDNYVVTTASHLRFGFFNWYEWGWLVIWDTESDKKIASIGGEDVIPSAIGDFAFSADGNQLAVGDLSGLITLWDTSKELSKWKKIGVISPPPVENRDPSGIHWLDIADTINTLTACCYRNPGKSKSGLSRSERINFSILWSLEPKNLHANSLLSEATFGLLGTETTGSIDRWIKAVSPLLFSPDNQFLTYYSHEMDGSIKVESIKDSSQVTMSPIPDYEKINGTFDANQVDLSYSPDGEILLTTGKGKDSSGNQKNVSERPEMGQGDVMVWNIQRKSLKMIFPAHQAKVSHIIYHPTKDRFATASEDGTVKIWKVEFPEEAWN